MIGFISGNQQDPDLMCEVLVTAQTDLIDGTSFPAVPPRRRRRTTLLVEARMLGSPDGGNTG